MRRVALALLLAACGSVAGPAGAPLPVSGLRPEDRALLGDVSRVTAIAAGFDRVYVAWPASVGIWHPLERRWEVPRAPRDAAMLRDVRGGAVDPLDRSLWLATASGWVHYTPETDRWDSGVLGGDVRGVGVDPADPSTIWFMVGAGWVAQPRLGGPARPARPPQGLRRPTLDDAMRDIPHLRGLAPTLLQDPNGVQGSFTAAAPAANGQGWYLGTTTRGAFFLDRTSTRPEPLALGLGGELVGAIAPIAGGVWVATDGDGRRSGSLTLLARDLTQATPVTGPPPFGLRFDAVRRILPVEGGLWLATASGLVHVTPTDGRARRVDASRLPDPRVLSLAQVRGRVVAGTMAGLVDLADDGTVTRRAPEFASAVYAMVGRGDTLWVATSQGLYASLQSDPPLRQPEGLRLLGGAARLPVRGVGYVMDTLVAMTETQLLWRDPVSGAWQPGPVLDPSMGPLTAFAATDRGVWVGGARGVLFAGANSLPLRRLTVPLDVPDRVTALSADAEYLWVGTWRGVMRFRLAR